MPLPTGWLRRAWRHAPLALSVSLAVLVSAGAIVGLFLLLTRLLGIELFPSAPLSGDAAKNVLDAAKVALGLAAALGAVVALVMAYRRQRVEERRHQLEVAGSRRDDQRLLTERFGAAADQLGHGPAVRLAGVYAMAVLADDWVDQQQTCIDVLCAYLRIPADPTVADREVRQSVIRVIRDHLQPEAQRSWAGRNFDFTGACFEGGDLRGAVFAGGDVSFRGAKFATGRMSLIGARFTGGDVSFRAAKFAGGDVLFEAVSFNGGRVVFDGATFEGGRVLFDRAAFSGSDVSFTSAAFYSDCEVDLSKPRDWTTPPRGLPVVASSGLLLPPAGHATPVPAPTA